MKEEREDESFFLKVILLIFNSQENSGDIKADE
jgi:hypothetical protein